MNEQTPRSGNYGFLAGLLTGTVVGAGVALWLTPTATDEARDRLNATARRLGDNLRTTTDGIRDQVVGAVARGAHEVARGAHDIEQFVVTGKSDRLSL
jgi:gas vesicle protein